MADRAWGSTSLSDEEPARALHAFRIRGPVTIQQRISLQSHEQQMPLLTPRPGPVNARSAFGYPSNGTYHNTRMSVGQNDAASMLREMHTPSTSSDDWQQQQNWAIRGQIEQGQRELFAQEKQKHQREMEKQLQNINAQIQQHGQVQRQPLQASRYVERIQQPQYSQETRELDHLGWNRGGYMAGAVTSNNSSQQAVMQQPTQFYDGIFQCSPQPPTTTSTNFAGNLQVAATMRESDRRFATQQAPQAAQSHFRARKPANFAASALHPWEMSNTLPFSEIPGDGRTMQMVQQFMPEQHQQPQPFHAPEARGRSDQEASVLKSASRTVTDDAFLNEAVSHFQTNRRSDIARASAIFAPTVVSSAAPDQNLMKDVFPVQFPPRAQVPARIQSRLDAKSRVPSPSAVVPGESLASEPVRRVTMRDILNVEDVTSKLNPSRSRPHGGNQQRAPRKNQAPKMKVSGKLQPAPQQRNEQRFSQPQSNMPSSSIANQSPSLGPSGASTTATKPCTPMYLKFMKSRAVRASQQTSDMASTKPSVPQVSATQPQRSAPNPVGSFIQATDRTAGFVIEKSTLATKKKVSYKRKRVDALPGLQGRPNTSPPEHQQPLFTIAPKKIAPRPETCTDKVKPNSSQESSTKSVLTHPQQALLSQHTRSIANVNYTPVGSVYNQRYQQPSHLSAPGTAKNNTKNNQVGGGSEKRVSPTRQRRRANLPQVVSKQLVKPVSQQQHTSTLSAPVAVSSSTITAGSPSVAQTLVVSKPPRVENRTVVIFCKRDFMRYQAAKIWRKYQDQLKKQEEWREVRVAGKRTRYLSSRYAEELQKQHNKTYKRAAKFPKKVVQEAHVACSPNATPLAAHADPVELAEARSRMVDNGDKGIFLSATDAESTDLGSLSTANEVLLNGKHDTGEYASVGVRLHDAPSLPVLSDGEINHAAPNNLNDSSNDTMVNSSDVRAEAVSGGKLELEGVNDDPKEDGVADGIISDYIEFPVTSEDHLSVKAISDCHVADSSPNVDELTNHSVANSDDLNIVVKCIGKTVIGDIDTDATGVVPSDISNTSSSDSSTKLGNAVVATESNGEADSANTDVKESHTHTTMSNQVT